jgi:uncharacterized protein
MDIEKSDLIILFFSLQPLYFLIVLVASFFWLRKSNNYQKIIKILVNGIFVTTLVLLLLGMYAHFYHRFDLQVSNHKIKTGYKAKFAVFSDLHLGKFKDQNFLQAVVQRINEQDNLDAVLIPGDFTYWPDISNLDLLFTPLKNLKVPVYAVLGNHDVQKPGPKLDQELLSSLTKNKVIMLDGVIKTIKLKSGTELNLVGLKDFWLDSYNDDNLRMIQSETTDLNYLVLAHQPDVVRGYKQLTKLPPLTITGHTHCGQVRIPGLYQNMLPVVDHFFDKGFYQVSGNFQPIKNIADNTDPKLFITCGVGEIGLPLRFNNPPTIDLFETY